MYHIFCASACCLISCKQFMLQCLKNTSSETPPPPALEQSVHLKTAFLFFVFFLTAHVTQVVDGSVQSALDLHWYYY